MVKTYGEIYRRARYALEKEEGEQAAFTARELLSYITGRPQAALMAMQSLYVPEETERQYMQLTERVLHGEPLAYIIGKWDFYGMTLTVTPDVLIPRDDTVAVAALAISQGLFLDKDPRILDLCCGSGCIGLAVANRVKDARVTLADLSQKALNIAKKNTALNHLSGRVRCLQADAMQSAPAFLGKFDMIVSNPPYITGKEMQELPRSVAEYEPSMALYGGEDGLDFYRAIVKNYTAALKPGGYLAFEFGEGQGDDVCRILAENGYTILERSRDYNDRERAVLARYGRKEA